LRTSAAKSHVNSGTQNLHPALGSHCGSISQCPSPMPLELAGWSLTTELSTPTNYPPGRSKKCPPKKSQNVHLKRYELSEPPQNAPLGRSGNLASFFLHTSAAKSHVNSRSKFWRGPTGLIKREGLGVNDFCCRSGREAWRNQMGWVADRSQSCWARLGGPPGPWAFLWQS